MFENRWAILALLTAARTVMAMQFQAVGAIGPALGERYGVGLSEIGFAIGLYFLPGIVIALPGAAVGARLGERWVVTASLVLMALGGALMAVAGSWGALLIGQALAGVGGVMLNILMTKMVADWFAGREIATALAIFINSWPLGIALSLVILPPLLSSAGAATGFGAIALLSAVFAVLVAALYRAPEAHGGAGARRRLSRGEVHVAILSGAVWGFFNAGLAIVFGFGTALLTEAGQSLEQAARVTSLVVWATAVVAPFGGMIADRMPGPAPLIAGALAVMGILTPLMAVAGGHWAFFVAIGIATGACAGAIMSLPAAALPPPARAVGMGVFFTVYYVAFVLAPPLGGWLSEAWGSAAAAFWLGGAFQAVALASLWGYGRAMRTLAAVAA